MRSFIGLLLIAVLLVGCSSTPSNNGNGMDDGANDRNAASEEATRMGEAAMNQGDADTALVHLQTATEENPYNARAHLYAGKTYLYLLGDTSSAFDPLLDAIANATDESTRADALASMGDWFLTTGSTPKSWNRGIGHVTEALTLNPGYTGGYLTLYRHYTSTGNQEGREIVLEQLQLQGPDAPVTRIIDAIHMAEQGLVEEALAVGDEYRERVFFGYLVAGLYSTAGDVESSLAVVENYLNTLVPSGGRRAIVVDWLNADPLFEMARTDERWGSIVQ